MLDSNSAKSENNTTMRLKRLASLTESEAPTAMISLTAAIASLLILFLFQGCETLSLAPRVFLLFSPQGIWASCGTMQVFNHPTFFEPQRAHAFQNKTRTQIYQKMLWTFDRPISAIVVLAVNHRCN